MLFTKEEFDIMVDELLYREPACFDMLCQIAEKTLRPSVNYWCNAEDCLRGREYEGDIMQLIHERLMLRVVTHFLLRKGPDQPVNYDPEGFEDWMFAVAKNLKKSFANSIRGRDMKTEELEKADGKGSVTPGWVEQEERIERLKQAFEIVLESDAAVYKILTWVAQVLFVIQCDVTKIQSNDMIIRAFADKTLNQMYEMILSASQTVPWMTVSQAQHERIVCALRKNWDDTVTYGEVPYKGFFMKHNGVVSGKKSISDWVNRLNKLICKKLNKELPDREKSKRRGSHAAPNS